MHGYDTTGSQAPALAPSQSALHVHPGRTVTSTDGATLVTIVGSGAVVCVWDPVKGVGGMSHFLLPEAGNAPRVPRFGDVALKALLSDLVSIGADARRLRARVYGGSAPPISDGMNHLGVRNISQALSFLTTKSVPVVDREVGGSSARKIVFNPAQGTAQVTQIAAAA